MDNQAKIKTTDSTGAKKTVDLRLQVVKKRQFCCASKLKALTGALTIDHSGTYGTESLE
jgi:hypothetical protein